MKRNILIVVASLAMTGFSQAVVTLQFTQPFTTTGGVAHNFADSAGVATNGLVWGIIIDTNGSGFATTYDQFTPISGMTMTLNSDAISTNVLVTSNVNTANNSAFSELNSTTFTPENTGGDGGIGSVTSIALGGANGVTQGDSFRLVWFDPSGLSAGFLDDGSFVIPADGNATDFSAVFRGSDPIRSATGIMIVPEPSAALLGVLGALIMFRRSRN